MESMLAGGGGTAGARAGASGLRRAAVEHAAGIAAHRGRRDIDDGSRPACRHERAGHRLPELSMGMSGDYPVAVEEGATMIRLGTLLFGERRA